MRGQHIKDLSHLAGYLGVLRWRYAGGTVFLLLTNGFALLIPWFMKLAVEGLQHPASASLSPAVCAMVIIGLAAGNCITRIFSRTLMLNAARIIEFRIREDLFQRLLLLDQAFFSTSRTGDILSRFSNDLTNVRMLVGFGAMSVINTLIIYVAAVTMMMRIHPVLTLCAVIPFPLMVLAVKQVSHNLFKHSLAAQEELARLTSLTEESVSTVRLIKAYCRENHFQGMYAEVSDQYLGRNLKLARLRGLLLPLMATATGAGTLIVLFLGGRLVISGAISLGDFVAFSGYLAMLVWPTAVMGWIMTLAQRGAASMSRLNEILEAESGVTSDPDAEQIKELRQGIEMHDLSFHYGAAKVLDRVSCHIRAGERIGVTGAVGSGKSTLLKLLTRQLPVGDGQILLDGRDINRINAASLRAIIGYVPQETFLFSRSIRENIAYGAVGGDADIDELVRQARLTTDIEKFHEGLETMVGEKGVALSGGQKQRLSIARALSANPRILLLDDPLSAVDAGREEEILGEMGRICGDRTVLIVSHRLSAFRDCDRVLVLQDGRIAEQGSPAELLEQDGLYAMMYRMQRLEEELL